MSTYQLTTNAEQEAALDWCLAEQKRDNPDEAPQDKAGLVLALMRDRVGQVVKQHEEAQAAAATDVLEAIKDTAKLATVRTALGLDK